MEKGTRINDDSDSDFLVWLSLRLQNLHNYHNKDEIIAKLESIATNLKNINIQILDCDIDKIISQYFTDFNLDKDEFLNLGYSDKERKNLRDAIKNISIDIFSKNIPKDFTLK